MFRRILLTALIAGTIAGLFAAVLQRVKIVPLIAAAEVYEKAGDAKSAAGHDHHPAAPAAAQAAEPAEWEPAAGFERTAYTVIADILAGIGFALILTGIAAVARVGGHPIDARRGLLWGAAGFAVFALAPAAGLAPELPGMAAAGLAARQAWWLLTAAATASGLGLVVFARGDLLKLAGAAVLVLPHLIGAPAAPHAGSTVPAELAAEFAAASLTTTALFWLLLGGLSGWLYQRFGGERA